MDRTKRHQIQAIFRRIEVLELQRDRHDRAIHAMWMGDARSTTYGIDHGREEVRLMLHPSIEIGAEIELLRLSQAAYQEEIQQLTAQLDEIINE